MKKKRIKLRYKKERVVFSDVLPYELPITFTNRFFYRFLVKNEVEYEINPLDIKKGKLSWKPDISDGAKQVLAVLFGIDSYNIFCSTEVINGKNECFVKHEPKIPFTYRIMHKRGKYRELAVIHPADQIKMVSFYEKYKSLILYYCQQSRFSLRHPYAVACYFYYRDRLHHTLLGKRSDDLELYFNEYENLKPTSVTSDTPRYTVSMRIIAISEPRRSSLISRSLTYKLASTAFTVILLLGRLMEERQLTSDSSKVARMGRLEPFGIV